MSDGFPDVVRELRVGGRVLKIFSLPAASEATGIDFSRLPFCLKVLAENLLRHLHRPAVEPAHVLALGSWLEEGRSDTEVAFHPGRVLMPEISGLPLLNDLCAMRKAMASAGGDPRDINPSVPIDLIVDHSVMVDHAGSAEALRLNMALEMSRNEERYRFLKWAKGSFDGLRIVPPGNGILHQVNIEHLATVVSVEDRTDNSGERSELACPDSLIGMDSHTPMVNALGIMGWGVGGLEAGAAMLGQAISLRLPEVVGCRLTGKLAPGVTATDLVLTVAQRLRAFGVVQKFVEFCGPGLDALAVTDRATLSNMAPEYGATMGFMPVDAQTVAYLRETGRSEAHVERVQAYCKAQGLWREADENSVRPRFTDELEIDLAAVEPSMAGPFRPNQRVTLAEVPKSFAEAATERQWPSRSTLPASAAQPDEAGLHDGAVALAAITSCTNTSNPSVMIGAGLLARNARRKGLSARPWVKTVLAPGSRVVADYLRQAGLQASLDELGFQVTGFGCTVCMGNSGELDPAVSASVRNHQLVAVAVLSGNRNFEGRVHPQCAAAYLASPPLVVAHAIAGTVTRDLGSEPLGAGADGEPVYLRDIWPSGDEVQSVMREVLGPALFERTYVASPLFRDGDDAWQALPDAGGTLFDWSPDSTYIVEPPYFSAGLEAAAAAQKRNIEAAHALLMVGDTVTTDHISPVSFIPPEGPAGTYLQSIGVAPEDFNGYAARRANHEVMVRGTFSSPRLVNELVPEAPAGNQTRHIPSGETLSIYDAAMRYQAHGTPLVVIAGREYGTGSSRDWAAKGSKLLGVRAVIAESIERIHRSNLVGMGVLPLQFPAGTTRKTLALRGDEVFSIEGLDAQLLPGAFLPVRIERANGEVVMLEALCRLDTAVEVACYRAGGMLHYALSEALGSKARP